jgi:hypothetical protein
MEEFSDIPNSSNNLLFGLSAFRVEIGGKTIMMIKINLINESC